jgi:8-oxo-dGTP pyrophosphatase MutT (NUDIX family)
MSVPPPVLATSVLVVRDAVAKIEVLMARRKAEMRFLGGFWVFPGGSMDPSDDSLQAAAARELFEETGLRISQHDGALNTDRIVPWARWITPSAANRRYDTHFFLTLLPSGQEARCDDSEIGEVRWIRPQDWAFGELVQQFPIAPPTQLILRELAAEIAARGSAQELLDAARSRRIRPVMPKLHPSHPSAVVFPWDAEYAQLAGESLLWDAEAIAERADWPGRLSVSVDLHKASR